MKSMRWFITGYQRDGRFEASAAAAPSENAGRGKQFDDLLYGDGAQGDGIPVWEVFSAEYESGRTTEHGRRSVQGSACLMIDIHGARGEATHLARDIGEEGQA
ncbi:hypothetical protein QF026_001353 [Streptomyces aurantiacus]|uniref:hypothetical protein n=1 Tax=Streptomyces aurantiacus TaxID=47760 RepID=UPI0027915A93|nr:hypothetical protein [Streptomyces aurantiacus]MDQ0772887.1 hypothetical protein [Streptomyces aurantiacus]